MNLPITKLPYIFLWAIIPFLIGVGLIRQNTAIDIQMHDTYFVVAIWHVGLISSLFLGLIGGIYWLFSDWEWVNWMTILHTGITVFFSLFILLLMIKPNVFFEFGLQKQSWMLLIGLIFMVGQLLFLINLVISYLRNKT